METPTDRSQTPQGETGSPRAAGEPAICDPGRHVSGPWCSRCGQWFVDGIWRNTPPETERSPRAPESAFACLCATDPDGCPIHRHYPAEVHSDDVMLSAVQAGSNRRRTAMLAQFTDDELVGELRLRRLERAAL